MVDERTEERAAEAPAEDEGPAPTPIRAFLVVACVMAIVITATIAAIAVPGNGPQVAPGRPVGLTGSATPFAVRLSWLAPPGQAVDRYVVLRDGTRLGTVRGLFYDDRTVLPGVVYRYVVLSVGSGGAHSGPATTEERPPLPPAAGARVQGVFDVRLHVDSASGVRLRTRAPRERWRLTPSCARGPCSVVWQDLVYPSVDGPVRLHGAVYRGVVSGYHGFTCGAPPARVRSRVTLSFGASSAAALDGAWRATRITGTLRELASSRAGGCATARVLYSFTATLRG